MKTNKLLIISAIALSLGLGGCKSVKHNTAGT
ncbi:hypothetical protein MNBD_GAMMA01-693, partial [hydrothermal vent metagenome]